MGMCGPEYKQVCCILNETVQLDDRYSVKINIKYLLVRRVNFLPFIQVESDLFPQTQTKSPLMLTLYKELWLTATFCLMKNLLWWNLKNAHSLWVLKKAIFQTRLNGIMGPLYCETARVLLNCALEQLTGLNTATLSGSETGWKCQLNIQNVHLH